LAGIKKPPVEAASDNVYRVFYFAFTDCFEIAECLACRVSFMALVILAVRKAAHLFEQRFFYPAFPTKPISSGL
jgi:hypothetical protein